MKACKEIQEMINLQINRTIKRGLSNADGRGGGQHMKNWEKHFQQTLPKISLNININRSNLRSLGLAQTILLLKDL